jgi:hypothetical protein
MCTYTLSLTSVLDGVGVQGHAAAALSPGKSRYPLYGRLGGPQDRSGWVRKTSPLPGFHPRTVQPVVSRYTDCANPAHNIYIYNVKVKVKESRYRPAVAQRVPGGLGSQIS